MRPAASQEEISGVRSIYAEGDIIHSKYVLEGMIAEGGMGAVWVARNLALDVRVALKFVRPGLDAPDAEDRLLDEARAAASLGHPAIVRVFDFGVSEQGDPFMVMELLEGRTLGAVLRQFGRIPAPTAVRTLLPVLDALAAAHQRGIVHRDLTPENIFLAREGRCIRPKIVDFGIVKLVGRARAPATHDGTIVGSPCFMSPEQARGDADVDYRADLWTACVALYEAVTGAQAFSGDDCHAVLRAVIESPVVPSTELGAGDEALWRILEKGLRKSREDRWQSARELGRALASWLVTQAVLEDICGQSIASVWLSDPSAEDGSEAYLDVARSSLPFPLVKPANRLPPRELEERERRTHGARPHPGYTPVAPASATVPAVPMHRTGSAPLVAFAIFLLAIVGGVAMFVFVNRPRDWAPAARFAPANAVPRLEPGAPPPPTAPPKTPAVAPDELPSIRAPHAVAATPAPPPESRRSHRMGPAKPRVDSQPERTTPRVALDGLENPADASRGAARSTGAADARWVPLLDLKDPYR